MEFDRGLPRAEAEVAARQCVDREHLGRRRACLEPVAARPYRLTRAQANEAHAEPWDGATIARYQARAAMLQRRGFCADDADDLTERLVLRDRQGDDRRICLECTRLGERGRCIAASACRIRSADRRLEPVPTILQRCEAFGLRKGLT